LRRTLWHLHEYVHEGGLLPGLVANDGLAVDQARPNRELADRHRDKGKARREIVSSACNQPYAGTIAAGQNAKAIA
jgi:hypothetical protein